MKSEKLKIVEPLGGDFNSKSNNAPRHKAGGFRISGIKPGAFGLVRVNSVEAAKHFGFLLAQECPVFAAVCRGKQPKKQTPPRQTTPSGAG